MKIIVDSKVEKSKLSDESDEKQREIYEMKSKILKDKVSALNEAERKGIEKGIEKGKKEGKKEGQKEKALEIARNLLDVLDNETIAAKTGLSVSEIENLR